MAGRRSTIASRRTTEFCGAIRASPRTPSPRSGRRALPTAIPNPFEPLVVAEQSTDGPLIEYALKLRAIRAQLEGTPIKVVTTTTFTEIGDVVGLRSYIGNDPTITNPKLTVVQQTQITNIAPADVDPKLFVIPDAGAGSPEQD